MGRAKLEDNVDASTALPPINPDPRLCAKDNVQSSRSGYPTQRCDREATGDSGIEELQANLSKIGKKMREAVRRSEGIIRETDDHIERERERIARKYPALPGPRSKTSHI